MLQSSALLLRILKHAGQHQRGLVAACLFVRACIQPVYSVRTRQQSSQLPRCTTPVFDLLITVLRHF
jgi:hypothetical protein